MLNKREIRYLSVWVLVIVICIAIGIGLFKLTRTIHYKLGYQSKVTKQIDALGLCKHENMTSIITDGLATAYMLLINHVTKDGYVTNMYWKVTVCSECGAVFVKDLKPYSYSELLNEGIE